MRAIIAVAILACLAIQPAVPQEPLKLLRAIELPRVEGRIDHLTLDASGRILFVAALGNNTVEVVDLQSGRHLKSLPGFREPQGLAGIADANAIAVANGQGNGVDIVSTEDYGLLRRVPLGDDSDNVRYDAATRRLYVGYASGALAALTPSDGKVLGRVMLAGHPESFQLEGAGPRIFVNVPDAGRIAVIDRNTMHVVANWTVSGAASNFPMALDDAGRRLFAGCRNPARLLIFDTSSGKEIGAQEIVGDTDDVFYDAARRRLYVAGGAGFIDVMDARQPATLTRLAHVVTASGARTALFAPEQSRLYLAVPHRGAQRAEIRVYEVRN